MTKSFSKMFRSGKIVKNLTKFISASISAFMFFAFYSCDVGLGESVDTQPPEISISYPPLGAVIRGEFVFSGSWSDDKGVSSVNISVVDTASKNTIDTISGTVSGSVWQASIDSSKYKDGTYQFTAAAADGAGHKTEASRSFDIDNTPPLFIASKPGVVKSSGKSASAYGSTFTVEGTIADSHDISKMKVSIFKEDGTFIDTFEENSISTVGGTSVTFANSYKGENDNYYKMYDNSVEQGKSDGTQKFYATITLYDSAVEYKNPAESISENTGNSTSTLYLYDDIYSQALSNASGGLGLTAADLMNISNGTSSIEESVQIAAKEILSKYAIETGSTDSEESEIIKENRLYFSLNPNANPTYTVNGYDVDLDKFSAMSSSEKVSAVKQLSGGGTVTVSFNAGLNATQIQPYGDESKKIPSVKVWVRKISSSSDLPSSSETFGYLTALQDSVKKLEKSGNAEFVTASTTAGEKDEWLLIYDYKQSNDESDSSTTGSFAVDIPSGIIESESYYLFGITGSDMDLMDFSQKASFVFQGTTAGFAPNVSITNPSSDALSFSNEAGFVFKGSSTISSGDSLYVKTLEADFKYSVAGSSEFSRYSEKFLVEKDAEGNSSLKKITGINSKNEYETADLTGNEALSYYLENVYKRNSDGTLATEIEHAAGTFEFDVSKIDGFSSLFALLNSGTQCFYNITMTSSSSSGHSATLTRGVNVDTVSPVLDDEKSSVGGIKTAAAILSAWFGSESLTVSGCFNDSGSGVESVTYWLDKNITEAETGTAVPSKNDNGTYSFKATISGFHESTEEMPFHTLKFIATDKAGNMSKTNEYFIKTDLTAPAFTPKYYSMAENTSIEGELSGNLLTNKENNVILYGLASDSASGLAAVSIPNADVSYTTASLYSSSTADDGSEIVTNVETDLNWFRSQNYSAYNAENASKITGWKAIVNKEKIVAGDVRYSIADIAGNSSSNRIFSFSVDTELPEIEYKELSDADSESDGIQVNGKIILSGTASDNNQMSKITELQYKILDSDGNGSWKILKSGLDSSKTSAYSWTSNEIDTSLSPFESSKNGDLTVLFRAVALDMAGNYSADSENGIKVVINQNSDRPVIKITSLDKDNAIISSESIFGTLTDDDGISKFEYSSDNGASWREVSLSSGSWKIDLSSGNHSLLFKVTDKTGTEFSTGTQTGNYAVKNQPYLVYSSGTEKFDNESAVKFAVDINPPEIREMKIAASDSESIPNYSTDEALKTNWSSDNVNFGKNSNYMFVYIKASEDVSVNENAKDDISMKIGSETIDFSSPDFSQVLFIRSPGDSLSGELVYALGPVDISKVKGAEGTKTVSVTLRDASGRENSATQNVYIDEAAPEVSITSPASIFGPAENGINGISITTDAITGKYTIKGRIADTSGISKFKYLIPTQAQVAAGISSETEGWIAVESLSGTTIDENEQKLSSSNWQIKFSSSDFKISNGSSLIYYATAKNDSSLVYAEKIGNNENVYVPLYFYVEDATGNGEIVKNKILVNPRGGVPTIEIITPENLAKTGGNLNFQGTASDDEGIEKVVLTKLQFSSLEAVTQDAVDAITDWKDVSYDILETEGVIVKAHKTSDGTIDGLNSDGTIVADGTNSWKISIDTSKIPDDALRALGISELKTVRAEIIAYDKNGTPSNYDVEALSEKEITKDSDSDETGYVRRSIFVDKNAPKLVLKQFVQFENGEPQNAAETPSVIRPYSAGVYISNHTGNGKWYLKGVVTDDASVEGVKISTSGAGKNLISLDGEVDSAGASRSGIISDGLKTKNFTFLIPIDTEKEGQFYPTIEMDDGQHSDVTENLSWFVDNEAPALYTTDGKTDSSLGHKENLRLTSNGLSVSEANVVENSDGSYSFGDTVVESRSGLDFVAVYFKKTANEKFTTKNRVYSPLFKNDNVEEVSDEKAADRVYINSEGLPALVKAVTRSAPNKISYSGLSENKFIRPFTMVKIGGSYIRITEIDGDVATLASDMEISVAECEFIYAQIVDHNVSEGFASDGTVTNDDGDGFVESLKQSGSSYRWSASVYSDNIPDGPAEIHVVVFDAAGNSNSGYVETAIANNRPRISRVMLATDLNGNGKFDFFNENDSITNDLSDDKTAVSGAQFGEFVFYSTLKVDSGSSSNKGDAQANVVLNGRNFKVKKDLLVLPEFVGGNGVLKYAYTLDNSKAADEPAKNEKASLLPLLNTSDTLKLADKSESRQTAASLIQAGENAQNYGGVFLKMDSSDSNVAGLDDGSVKYLAFTFWDSTPETTQGQDSLWAMINIPAIIDVTDTEKPNGTIKPFWWSSKEDSSFVYDDDGQSLGHIDLPGAGETKPGVSGEIFINGTSFDDTRIGEIHIIKPNGTVGGDGDVKIIWNENGEWKTSEGTEILSEEEPSQDGHTVAWRCKIDMTPYGIATDKSVKTYVVDAQANTQDISSESQQTTEEKPTCVYNMDFVPYIKSIYPAVSGSANRSRLGKFPVRAGEDMVIEGMNFASGASYTVNFYKSKTTSDGKNVVGDAVAAEKKTGTILTDGKITVKAPPYSRWVEVVVGGVATRNNTNENSGYNIEEGYVAGAKNEANEIDNGLSKANKAGTNFWTDDRYISVWNVGTAFDGSINPHSGLVKKIRKEDSINSSGSVGLKKKGSHILPTADMTDGYLGFISSDDMRVYVYEGTTQNVAMSPTSDVSLFTAPVDAVDMVVLGGLPYYVLQTNYVGNVNANCWGPGLMLAREGFAYEKGTYEGTTGLGESSLKWIIERQGSNNSATGRNSSDGYDSILYQFKNPRIAGWHTDSPPEADRTNYDSNNKRKQLDYVYVSYYDSYAKCLKFAAFRSGRDVDGGNISTINTTVNNQWGGGNAGDNELVAEIRSADGNMKTGATVVAGYDTTQNNPTKFTEKAGEWSDIVVDATGGYPIPVIVYYNESKKCLEVARGKSKFPKSKNYKADSVTELSGADAWTKTKEIRPGNSKADFGRYVSCAIDSSGNLHVAAQNATNSTLYYLYLKKSGETYSVTKSVLLDSSSGSGLWTDIELTNPSGTNLAEIRPVVSYINSSYVGTKSGMKAAYISDGAKDDVKFDVMTAPSEWAVGNHRTSVMADVREKSGGGKAQLAVGFNSDMFAVDFLRGED